MAVRYEWCIETLDEAQHSSGTPQEEIDVVDHDFDTDLSALIRANKSNWHPYRICLVRYTGDEDTGETGRHYAYVTVNVLPGRMSEGYDDGHGPKVPERFHRELSSALG